MGHFKDALQQGPDSTHWQENAVKYPNLYIVIY